MATAPQYMQDEFAKELELNGHDVTIDGVDLKCFFLPLDPSFGERPGMSVARISYWLLPGALSPLPPMGAELDVNGTKWLVELVVEGAVTDQLRLFRYLG